MSDDGKTGGGQRQSPEPSDADLRRRLEGLSERLRAQETREPPPGGAERDLRGFAILMRLSSEFVAGVIVGVGLGWVFDRLLGASPWGLIVFTILGFIAGVYNMMRAVGRLPKPGETSRPNGPNDAKH